MNQELSDFIALFKTSEYWAVMQRTIENSPWHREANVAVHTEMSIEQYLVNFSKDRSELEQKLAIVALLFHDTGKPAAEEVVEKKDGSGDVYRRYAGHEQDSAVSFTECYVTMPELRALLTPMEARAVRWTIEHHLPYSLKDKTKRQGLRSGTFAVFNEISLTDATFFDCLRSDGLGRISDDHETKTAAVEEWITAFREITPIWYVSDKPTMYILIGASGSGKTTWRNALTEKTYVISHDDMKVEFWELATGGHPDATSHEIYELAWKYATLDHESEFKKFAHQRAIENIERALCEIRSEATAKISVVVDIVNANKRRRQQFVDMAHRFGFRVEAVEFWNSFTTLSARQKIRGDKHVPDSSIRQQLNATTCAWIGAEAETVQMVIGS